MATVDASIPLQVKQPKSPLESYAETIQLAQGIQNFQGQQAMRDAFANADTSTPEGQQALIKKVGAADPKEALALQSQFTKQKVAESTLEKNKAQTSKANLELGIARSNQLSEVGTSMMMTYGSLRHQGVPDAQARQIVAQSIPSIKAHLASMKDGAGNPLFPSDMIDKMQPTFDPQQTMSMITDSKQRAQLMTQQHQQETADEQKRHARVEEGQGQQRIGIEGARLGEERRYHNVESGMARERLNMEEGKSGLMPDPQNPGKFVKDPSVGLSDDDLKFMARQYLAGDKSVLQNLGRGAQGARDLVSLRKSIREEAEAKGMKPDEVASTIAEFEGLKSGERKLGERTAVAGMAANEASQFADLAVQASDKINRTQYPSLNKVLQAAEKGTGDPEIVKFAAYNNSLINAYARTISPTGTPTVSDKEHARDMLDTAFSNGQYKSVVGAMKQEIAAAQRSPGMVREEFRGYGKRQIGPADQQQTVPNPLQQDGGGAAKGGGDYSHLWN